MEGRRVLDHILFSFHQHCSSRSKLLALALTFFWYTLRGLYINLNLIFFLCNRSYSYASFPSPLGCMLLRLSKYQTIPLVVCESARLQHFFTDMTPAEQSLPKDVTFPISYDLTIPSPLFCFPSPRSGSCYPSLLIFVCFQKPLFALFIIILFAFHHYFIFPIKFTLFELHISFCQWILTLFLTLSSVNYRF